MDEFEMLLQNSLVDKAQHIHFNLTNFKIGGFFFYYALRPHWDQDCFLA